jgi:hypothetical protein
MAERLARRKAAQDAAANPQANQALRYGVTNPPAVQPEPKKQGGFGGGWGPNIMNALNSIVSLTPPMLVANGISKAKDLATGNGDWTEPLKTVDAIPSSFQSTGSNLIDLLPYVDTKELGINYVNDWNQGHGITTGIEDAMNIAAIYGGAKAGINSFPSIKSGLAEELARFQAGNDAGVLGYGGRERPQLNLTGQPKPRLTADQLSRATGESPFAQGIGDIIKNTVQDVPRANPAAGAKMPPNMMEDYIAQLTSELDSMPEWMKPKVEKPQIQRPINEPMTPAKAQQYATPIGNQNQIWPSNWDNVNLGKEIDLTKRFANASEATMAGKDAANKWAAQKAFRDQLMQQIENGNVSSFNSNVFPSYIKTPQDMIRFVEISDLSTLINNPIMANDYIDLMRLFGQ